MNNNIDDRTIKNLNSSWYKLMFECFSEISNATHDFFRSKKFKTALLPITTGSISSPMGLGSDSVPVKINLMGTDTYLADSMQFLLEYSMRFNQDNVFYMMPTFRGEDADKRHLNQFYHSEAEIKGDLSDIIILCEEYIKYLSKTIIENNKIADALSIEKINEIKNLIMIEKFPEIRFSEALHLLKENNVTEAIEYDNNDIVSINSFGERWLIKYYNTPIWLTHFEHISVPFYQAYDSENKKYALAADLLLGIGETIGCGERANYNELLSSLEDHKISSTDYQWYIDMKKNAPLQTSGFGMGVERYIAWLFDIDDIREIPYVYREKNKIIYP